VAGIAILALSFQLSAAAREKSTTQSSRASSDPQERIEQKLDDIAGTQQEILRRFDQVMEELQIVKIRATVH